MTSQWIGIDPGPTPGIVVMFRAPRHPLIVQCSADAAPTIFSALLAPGGVMRHCVQTERFVDSRHSRTRAGAVTRAVIDELAAVFRQRFGDDDAAGSYWVLRNAGQVKPWATDERLDAAGLLEPTKGMRHARDAARHALFCAVKDGGLPDPLSREHVA